MKTFLIIIVSLSFSICAFGQDLHVNNVNNILTGKWRLIEFKNIETGVVIDTTNQHAFFKHVILNFHDSANTGGIKGKSFCNDVGGSYRIYGMNKIVVDGFGGTKVGCHLEGDLWDAFRAASSYKRSSDTLIILYNNDTEEMIFKLVK
ncbi:MAG: META domain-containing protein [Bacteroidia bacterium]|jgi:hypothetical protein